MYGQFILGKSQEITMKYGIEHKVHMSEDRTIIKKFDQAESAMDYMYNMLQQDEYKGKDGEYRVVDLYNKPLEEQMSFEWHRMHKHEEQIENDVYDRVMTQILEHYEIEELSELTEEQWAEIHKWQEENVGEYSPMNMGFSDCYNQWENEQDY